MSAVNLYPVWRKETQLGYQYIVGEPATKNNKRPAEYVFIYSIGELSRERAADRLKNDLKNLEPRPMYWGEENHKFVEG